jgi:SAM-dependent methyltransferase
VSSPYQEAAFFYARARPPYSDRLVPAIAERLGLDGTGRMLDAGCGPGVLARMFADRFESVVGLDPEPAMLAEAARLSGPSGQWVRGRAEDIPALGLGTFRLVTFGQSYHWTDRPLVADIVHDILSPGGAMAVVNHVPSACPPPGPGAPPIPHDEIDAVLARFPGAGRRGRPNRAQQGHEVVLAASRFGPPERLVLPGRADLVRTADDILADLYSTSFAAPNVFGARRAEFEDLLLAMLARHSPDGRFWEFPGDTEVLLGLR